MRVDELSQQLLKSQAAAALYSFEIASRACALHERAGLEDGEIRSLKARVKDLEKEKRQSNKDLEAARSEVEAMKLQVTDKDKEIKEKVSLLETTRAELETSQSRCSDLANESTEQRSKIQSMDNILEERERTLKDAEEQHRCEMDAQFIDFVGQVEVAMNINFLDGWEAAMRRLNVDNSSQTYRDVPFPNPGGHIPPFSFEVLKDKDPKGSKDSEVTSPGEAEAPEGSETQGSKADQTKAPNLSLADQDEDQETIAKIAEIAQAINAELGGNGESNK